MVYLDSAASQSGSIRVNRPVAVSAAAPAPRVGTDDARAAAARLCGALRQHSEQAAAPGEAGCIKVVSLRVIIISSDLD